MIFEVKYGGIVAILIGILSSILSVILIGILLRIRLYFKLCKLNGEDYIGYDLNGTQHENKKYSVFYSMWSRKLIIKQESSSKGNWISKIHLGQPNFLEGIGNFKYLNDSSETWGIHKVIINLEDKIINITAESKGLPRTDNYIIKKK